MGKAKQVALLCFVFSGLFAHAYPTLLLPHPQKILHEAGSIPLTGMKIVFSSTPSAEDQFAAGELSKYVEERTGLRVPVQNFGENPGSGPVILLDRVGATDHPLALPGDLPGPNSSEAYDLAVTAQGVKIHARSSAGIFDGIQTLRQLIEGSGSDAILPQVEIHDWPSVELITYSDLQGMQNAEWIKLPGIITRRC